MWCMFLFMPTTIKLISTFSHFFANLFGRVCIYAGWWLRWYACLRNHVAGCNMDRKKREKKWVETRTRCNALHQTVYLNCWNRWMCTQWKRSSLKARQSEPFSMHCFCLWTLFCSSLAPLHCSQGTWEESPAMKTKTWRIAALCISLHLYFNLEWKKSAFGCSKYFGNR